MVYRVTINGPEHSQDSPARLLADRTGEGNGVISSSSYPKLVPFVDPEAELELEPDSNGAGCVSLLLTLYNTK
jgi:hypothetical protein